MNNELQCPYSTKIQFYYFRSKLLSLNHVNHVTYSLKLSMYMRMNLLLWVKLTPQKVRNEFQSGKRSLGCLSDL